MSVKEYGWQQNELGEYSYTEIEKRRKMPLWLTAALVSAAVCIAFLAVYSACILPKLRPNTVISHLVSGDAAPQADAIAGAGFAGVGEKVSDSIVAIPQRTTGGGFFSQMMSYGGGSGVVVSADGYILTSISVAESPTVTVRLADGSEHQAQVVGTDNRLGISVLKIEKSDLKPIEFADSDIILSGMSVAAIGRILNKNLGTTLTTGTVSGVNKSVTLQNGQSVNLLQTDAAVDASAGTVLLDNSGKAVGMITGMISSGVDGIELAVMSNDIVASIESLINIGTAPTGLIIGIQGMDTDYGVSVEAVSEGSAAEKGGIKVGDLIVKADKTAVKSVAEINKLKDAHTAGDIMTFTVYREGEMLELEIKLG